MPSDKLPLCIGHRGASAAFPENSLASFERAIADGAHGIETDVHISSDDIILMFHDAYLERVTDGNGLIKRQPYSALSTVRTKKQPAQPIATFEQTIDLLMRPGNSHVLLNLDLKVDNEPEKLFTLMRTALQRVPDYSTKLAPRLILGIWHPVFLEPAKRLLPECARIHIGFSTDLARRCFWNEVDGFSMNFAVLVSADGEAFRKACATAEKTLWVWTVNGKPEMLQAVQWGVDAILTDKTADYLALRSALENGDATAADAVPVKPSMSYFSLMYYSLFTKLAVSYSNFLLTRKAGPMQVVTSKTLTL